MNHTPGPYKKVPYFNEQEGVQSYRIFQDRGQDHITGQEEGMCLAEMVSFTGRDEGNANLFATASDLWEACDFVYRVLEEKLERPRSGLEQACIDKLKRALDKATGVPSPASRSHGNEV